MQAQSFHEALDCFISLFLRLLMPATFAMKDPLGEKVARRMVEFERFSIGQSIERAVKSGHLFV